MAKKTEPVQGGGLKLILRLLREFMPDSKRKLYTAILMMMLVAGSTAAIALITRKMVNSVFIEGNATMNLLIAGVLAIAFVVKGVATFVADVQMGDFGGDITASAQRKIFAKLLELPTKTLTERHPGKIVSGPLRAAKAASSTITLLVVNVFKNLVTLIVLSGVMIAQAPYLSLLIFAFAPLAVFGIVRISRAVASNSRREEQVESALITQGIETIEGILTVKSFQLERPVYAKLTASIETMKQNAMKMRRLLAISTPLMESIGGLAIGALVIYAGHMSQNEQMSPGDFVAFVVAFMFAYEPAKRLGSMNAQLQRNLTKVERLYRLLDSRETEFASDHNAPKLSVSKGEVRFEDVTFTYSERIPAVRDLSMSIEAGRHVAIVGRSGAGKSTVVSLLLRIRDVDSGRILIDGQDISTVSLQSLRNAISLVSQHSFLFSGTIRENILVGKEGASQEELEAVCQSAGALSFIREMPAAFDTEVGPNGFKLSGGQRQRIAIARALLKNAPILVLDEAMSSVDGETDTAIGSLLNELKQEKTIITIAHRYSTVAVTDHVYLLDSGRLVAEGPPERLRRESSLFTTLFPGDRAAARTESAQIQR